MKKIIFTTVLCFLCINYIYSQNKVTLKVISKYQNFSVTYGVDTYSIQQITSKLSDKWQTDIQVNGDEFIYISAQTNLSESFIEVYVYYNDNLIDKKRSTGDYVISSLNINLNNYNQYKNIDLPKIVKVYSNTPVLSHPSIDSTTIDMILNNEVELINKIDNRYYKVKYNNKIGYIFSGNIKKNQD